jgi:hypothetical protein
MNKTALKRQAKEILNRYDANHSVSNDNDYKFLISIFSMHPSWDIKRGCGVRDIIVRRTQYGDKCFYVVRDDGSQTDISYNKSVDGDGTKISEINKACRTAVRDIVIAFREDNVFFGESICPFTGEVLFKHNTHIDHHDKTFSEVFSDWIQNKDKDYLYSKINEGSKDGEMLVYFKDQSIVDDFVSFHNANTNLRAVSKIANLSILRK